MPYNYAAGRFQTYGPRSRKVLIDGYRVDASASYNFSSEPSLWSESGLLAPYFRGQTVEQIIISGYLAVPHSDPEIALISDKRHVAHLGLDDLIGQIRDRFGLYQQNMTELAYSMCEANNSVHRQVADQGRGQVRMGDIVYSGRELYPFHLRADRLKEHVLICGRSGSGKTNLTFELMRSIMEQDIKIVALDWKRGYRDLHALRPDLRIYTIGRKVAPFRFNPLIPPPGCEPNVWIKLVVDVIASAYLGGEGVISLLVGGLADEHPEPFLIHVPRCPVNEGAVDDAQVRQLAGPLPTDSTANSGTSAAIPRVPPPDKYTEVNPGTQPIAEVTHPPPQGIDTSNKSPESSRGDGHRFKTPPPPPKRSREEIRFLADLVARPLSTTVARYQRLGLSRRRGNAIRRSLASGGLIEAVPIATRSGQVVLYQLTELGRLLCPDLGIDPGLRPHVSLEHRYWVHRAEDHFVRLGYQVVHEHVIEGNGAIDLLAENGGRRLAIEIETGKSKIKTNIEKVRGHGFDEVILIATCPTAVAACQRAIDQVERGSGPPIQLWAWLDVS